MYRIKKRIEIAGAHMLNLPYESKCNILHGHNWIITVEIETENLDDQGMVIDFGEIKKVARMLDHGNINTMIEQPTAENIAFWFAQQLDKLIMGLAYRAAKYGLPRVVKVTVQESEGNEACFIP